MTAPDMSLDRQIDEVQIALDYATDHALNPYVLRSILATLRLVKAGKLVPVVPSGMTDAEGNTLYYKDESHDRA